jgi:predicted Zn finger-like uncharacterized protein
MSDDVHVACPHCGSQFRLKNRQSLGKKITCRNCSEEFTAREAEEDEYAAVADLSPAPARRSAGGRRRKKSGRFRVNRWVIVGAGLILVVLLGVIFSDSISPYFSRTKQLADLVGLQADSPEKVLDDIDALRNEIDRINDAIDSKASHEAAFGKFNSMLPRADELVLRASRLSPLTQTEFDAVMKPRLPSVEEMQKRFAGQQPPPRQNPSGLPLTELLLPSVEVRSRVRTAADVISTGLRPLPDPQNDLQKVEHDAIAISRKAARVAARVKSSDDLESVATDVAGLTKEMKQVVERAEALEPVSESAQEAARYITFDASSSFHLTKLWIIFESRFGRECSVNRAISELEKERLNVHGAITRMKGRAAIAQATADAGFQRPFLPGQLTPGDTPSALGGLPSSPQAMRDDFLKRHGPDGVLTVTAMKYPGDKLSELSRQLREVTGANQNFAFADIDGTTYVYLAYAGNVDEVAGCIDFCKVVAVDAGKRTITIEPRDA